MLFANPTYVQLLSKLTAMLKRSMRASEKGPIVDSALRKLRKLSKKSAHSSRASILLSNVARQSHYKAQKRNCERIASI